MPTTDKKPAAVRTPGRKTAVIIMLLLFLGCCVFALLIPSWTRAGLEAWPTGALVGFFLSGAMGLWSLRGIRRALDQKQQGAFVRTVFGNMLLRLVLTGVFVGLILGLGWLHAFGFVGGMFGGLVVFQIIEISAVATTTNPDTSSVEGATNHAR